MLLVPRLRLPVDRLPRELVGEEERREPRQPRDALVERAHPWERATGHYRAPAL